MKGRRVTNATPPVCFSSPQEAGAPETCRGGGGRLRVLAEAESCIRGTMALMSQCLWEGENVTLVLRDLGTLLIKGTGVEMKFY